MRLLSLRNAKASESITLQASDERKARVLIKNPDGKVTAELRDAESGGHIGVNYNDGAQGARMYMFENSGLVPPAQPIFAIRRGEKLMKSLKE